MKFKGCIIGGVLAVIVGSAMVMGVLIKNDFKIKNISNEDLTNVEKSFSGEIATIKYDCSMDNVLIKAVDREDIYVKGKEVSNFKYNFDVSNNTLTIQNEPSFWYQKVFMVNLFSMYAKANEEFVIEVPNNKAYDLDIKMNAGSFKLNDIEITDGKFEFNASTNKFENVTIANGTFDINAATSTMTNVNLGNVNCDFSAATLKINSSTIDTLYLNGSASTINFESKVNNSAHFDLSAATLRINLIDGKENYMINGIGNSEKKITYTESASSVTIE